MKCYIAVLSLFLCQNIYAAKSLDAHEHGSVTLSVSVDKNVVVFDLESPAESFLGFEYEPKSIKEKTILKDVEKKWKDFKDLLFFDSELGCTITSTKFERIQDGGHSEIEASTTLICKKELKGATLTVSILKHFKNIKKMKLEVVSEKTFSVEIKKPVQEVGF